MIIAGYIIIAVTSFIIGFCALRGNWIDIVSSIIAGIFVILAIVTKQYPHIAGFIITDIVLYIIGATLHRKIHGVIK